MSEPDLADVRSWADNLDLSPEFPGWLNLGCGTDVREGWHNVDVDPTVEPDELVNLEEIPWPWPDGHFWHIEARHILEHLDPVPWQEIQRVLRPGGSFRWVYPIGHTRFEDGSHEHYWNTKSAEWVVGDGKHGHEAPLDMVLVRRDVEWSLSEPSRLQDWRVRYRLWRWGPGPWMDQVAGLYGEMNAMYRFPTEDYEDE